MSKFLDDFLITMPTTQRRKLMDLLRLRQQEGWIRSEQELQAELKRLLENMERREGGPTFQARLQEGKTDSASFNANMEEIAFDLATLFEASASIDRIMGDNQQLSRSLLSSMKKKIFTLQSELEKYKMLMKHSDGFIDGIHEQFNAPMYTETEEKVLQSVRSDRFDKRLSAAYNAETIGDALQLAGVQTMDQLKTNYGRRLARVDIINRTGHPSSHPEHGVDKAVDGSKHTYWAETILVDQPIVQDVKDIWGAGYNGVPTDGALCEMKITLNGMTTVSDIHFDPFCSYPMEVVSIHGYETMDMGGAVYELISPNHPNPHQRNKKSVHQMTFQFPSVDVSVLRIVLRQENYVKENYIMRPEETQNMELWQKLTAASHVIEDEKQPHETMASFDRKNEITGWSVYLEKLKEWASSVKQDGVVEAAKRAMETIRLGDYKNPMLLKLQALVPGKQEALEKHEDVSASWKAVHKLSYLYGAYDISVFGRKYQNQSVYVTKPLPLSSNAMRISLDTEEKHHDVEIGTDGDTARITDIEYYMTHKKNPTATDWHPILPLHKQYVEGELLAGDMIPGHPPEFEALETAGEYLITYSFRFPVASDKTVVLRRNGVPMHPSTYVISEDGKKIAIFSKYYAASSVYTVSYKPTDDAWFFTLHEGSDITPTQYIDENGETGEFFDRADLHQAVELKHKPYLFRQEVFRYHEEENRYEVEEDRLSSLSPEFPIIVRVNGEEYQNITNYASNTYDASRLTENDGKTFAQIGNRLVFGKPIDGSLIENITVDYYYVATDIRMKAILRRNSVEDESVTPALYSYHIRCQSYDQEA